MKCNMLENRHRIGILIYEVFQTNMWDSLMRNLISRTTISVMLMIVFLGSSGCDWGAMWDLHRAEKALKKADYVNAEHWAEREYHKAQKLFDEAVELQRGRKINEARDKASECVDWAEEAEFWAILRADDMEREKNSLNSKKY